jgi:hypothetical protein
MRYYVALKQLVWLKNQNQTEEDVKTDLEKLKEEFQA